MAGYIFSLGKNNAQEILKNCIYNGCYSTNMSPITEASRNFKPFEATFADYCSMKPGDNIYFFTDRKLYGIGELISIGNDCKFVNYPTASIPIQENYNKIYKEMILNDNPSNVNNRWICIFKPSPAFYCTPVDMDDVLSYKPDTFKTLRTFWKKSFTKINDEENNSLKEFILLRNQNNPNAYAYSENFQNKNKDKFQNKNYLLSYEPILDFATTQDNKIKHEMALESAIVLELSNNENSVFGNWDYISHQVEASPFKPIDYMDKIDVFGYRFLPNTKIVCKYLIIENKNEEATIEVAEQISKYVDWVVKNYAYGNYEMVEAYIVAPSFSNDLLINGKSIVERKYIISSHPVENKMWNDLNFVSYNCLNQKLTLKKEGI